MKKPVNPFDVADDNAFLAALDSAIGARMIPEEGIPEEQFAVLGLGLMRSTGSSIPTSRRPKKPLRT